MSRPQGPPPYTEEQIARLISPAEQFVARSELNSYIMGHQIADERDLGLRSFQPSYCLTNLRGGGSTAISNSAPTSPTREVGVQVNAGDISISSSPNRPSVPQRGAPRNRGERQRFYQPYPTQQSRPTYDERLSNRIGMVTVSQPQIARRAFGNGILMACEQQSDGRQAEPPATCLVFIATGKCSRFRCPDVHDIEKLALCKRFLYRSQCAKGDGCLLSHIPNEYNTPHCVYFLDGECTKASCIFMHATIDKSAPVCVSFGTVGYCSEGMNCPNIHAHECPNFANEGSCPRGDSCPVRHVRRASRMRAAALDSSDADTPASPDNDDSDDIGASSSEIHAITQQQDYIPLDDETQSPAFAPAA